MDTERIEEALRDGPPDEPAYRQGGYRRRWSPVLLLAGVGALATTAVVTGVLIAVTLSLMRAPGGQGGGVDVLALGAELQGTWDSNEITATSWRSELMARGHTAEDVDAAHVSNGNFDRVRYRFVFAEQHLQVFAAFDGQPWEPMSGGPYELQADGSLLYDDIGCFITAMFTIDEDQLSFAPIETRSCNPEEMLNNAGFFNLVTFTR